MYRFAHLLLLLVLLSLLAPTAACDSDSPTEPTPPPDPNQVFYTSIGASDAVGVGASVPCVPFTECPQGTGYVQSLTRRFRSEGRTVELTNLGIPGAVLAPEVQEIGNRLGRGIPGNFLQRELPFVPRNSTLVTIFAGGNDVNTIGEAVRAGQGGSDPAGFVGTQISNFGRDMRSLVTGVRDRAPNARVIVLNLPNFSGLPFLSGLGLPEKRVVQQIAVGFSAGVNATATQNVLVIDLMCDPRSYQPGNYSGDGFHPSDAGYAFMTELVYTAAIAGSAAPPRASCPEMAMF